MTSTANEDERLPLRAEQRSVADARIVEGAMAVFAEKGLAGTVDDVAEAAGVSRRTVFRHFASQGELFAAVIVRGFQVYEDELSQLSSVDEDCEPWLANTAARVHQLNRELLGNGFWDIHVQRPGTAPEVVAAIAELYGRRIELFERLAHTAWRASGGKGRPPRLVVDAFAILLSAFATTAMESYQTQDAGRLSTQVLSAVLSMAVAEQHARAGREHQA